MYLFLRNIVDLYSIIIKYIDIDNNKLITVQILEKHKEKKQNRFEKEITENDSEENSKDKEKQYTNMSCASWHVLLKIVEED